MPKKSAQILQNCCLPQICALKNLPMVIAKQSRGITIKKKKSKYNRTSRDNVANPGVTLNHSSRKHDSDLCQWPIWTNYVCQYGGTYQGF